MLSIKQTVFNWFSFMIILFLCFKLGGQWTFYNFEKIPTCDTDNSKWIHIYFCKEINKECICSKQQLHMYEIGN